MRIVRSWYRYKLFWYSTAAKWCQEEPTHQFARYMQDSYPVIQILEECMLDVYQKRQEVNGTSWLMLHYKAVIVSCELAAHHITLHVQRQNAKITHPARSPSMALHNIAVNVPYSNLLFFQKDMSLQAGTGVIHFNLDLVDHDFSFLAVYDLDESWVFMVFDLQALNISCWCATLACIFSCIVFPWPYGLP